MQKINLCFLETTLWDLGKNLCTKTLSMTCHYVGTFLAWILCVVDIGILIGQNRFALKKQCLLFRFMSKLRGLLLGQVSDVIDIHFSLIDFSKDSKFCHFKIRNQNIPTSHWTKNLIKSKDIFIFILSKETCTNQLYKKLKYFRCKNEWNWRRNRQICYAVILGLPYRQFVIV